MSGCYENEIEHGYLPFAAAVLVALFAVLVALFAVLVVLFAVLVAFFAALVEFFAAAESVSVFVIAAVVMAEKMCLRAEDDDF